MRTVDEWKGILRAAVKEAMRARQAEVVAVMRETLAAIDNAEAPSLDHAPAAGEGPIAGSAGALGAGEIARRALTAEEVLAIVHREIRERKEAAATWEALGKGEEAVRLRGQAEALAAL